MAPMTLQQFSAESQSFWNDYLARIAARIGRLEMRVPNGFTPYYPTAILITEMPHHFAMELVGLGQKRRSLTAIGHKADCTDSYLGTFLCGEGPVIIDLRGDGDITDGMALVSPLSVDALERRFPGVL